MLIFRFLSFIRRSRCDAICSSSFPPTVPTPQTNRFSSWYSERKKLSWITFRALRRFPRFTMNDMLLSEEPWAQAITLMPLRPSVPNSFPAMPAWYFMFSPTTATAASSFSMCTGSVAPLSISWRNSLSIVAAAAAASFLPTPIVIPVSEADWLTRNALMFPSASTLNMRLSIPTIPTMEVPVSVIRLMSSIEDMPLMSRSSLRHSCLMEVPGAAGLKVFLISMGMPLRHTAYRVGGYITFAPKLQSSIASA